MDAPGLSAEEAGRLLTEVGPNELERTEGTPAWRMLAAQFTSPLVVLLAVATAVSAATGEVVDAVAIGTIVMLNGVIGFWQERGAQDAVLALRAMTAPRARVVRDGQAAVIPAAEVVPGDLLLLEAGDVVAADARLVAAHDLAANEAALTGESEPVVKATVRGEAEEEGKDAVFMGTHVVAGSGSARVTATGMRTQLGGVAHLLEHAEDAETPLQRELARVGRSLLWICLAVVAVIAGLGLARGEGLLAVLLSAIPLAVAAVPEGLPAVVTIALAVGVRRMAARHVLVRRLPAVETLGSATVICTDKTGTLTTGIMEVRELWGPDHGRLLDAAAACCDAELHADGSAVGDPTEVAILRAAWAHGLGRAAIEAARPRVAVHPFDSDRKRMSVLRADGVLYVKGAVDLLLPLCASGVHGVSHAHEQLAGAGLRVLGVATGARDEEANLELLGLIGMADPPRPEAIRSIAAARAAGVRVVMITGDHRSTALAIAREVGVLAPGEEPEGRVYARVTPAEKLQLVRTLRNAGEVVAMTGDGVNDAPALREAHIGIAMGLGGTEVTREAADMVLANDDFASVIAAVREGRGVWDNIRKTLIYLLTGNTGELMVVLTAGLLGWESPLLPLQLLWINLVTDGLPALALVLDPPSPGVLQRPPRPPAAAMLDRGAWGRIAGVGALEASLVLAVFASWSPTAEAGSMAFVVIVFSQVLRALGARSHSRTFWTVGAGSNLTLVAVVVCTLLAQVLIVSVPFTQALLHTAPLSPKDMGIAFAVGLIPVTLIELEKVVRGWWRARTE